MPDFTTLIASLTVGDCYQINGRFLKLKVFSHYSVEFNNNTDHEGPVKRGVYENGTRKVQDYG